YEDDALIGYLALYAFNNKEAEVSTMVRPDYRRQGIFRQLLAAAGPEIKRRGIPDLLFICEQTSTSGTGSMQAIEAQYEFSEYKMALKTTVKSISKPELHLRQAQSADIATIFQLDKVCFDVSDNALQIRREAELADSNRQFWMAIVDKITVGKIQVVLTGAEIYISGFCLFPKYRGQGYGTMILGHTVEQLIAQNHQNIVLEVATENKSALLLYEKCGFEVVTAYDYYRLSVNLAVKSLCS
ncbi:MAG: GNAT family N-acetyltransferase, partial [Gammaproteobacteria bacterium]|nr:GNAT family N-acetyltransferase [Gammaproteobacteria bacterium]